MNVCVLAEGGDMGVMALANALLVCNSVLFTAHAWLLPPLHWEQTQVDIRPLPSEKLSVNDWVDKGKKHKPERTRKTAVLTLKGEYLF